VELELGLELVDVVAAADLAIGNLLLLIAAVKDTAFTDAGSPRVSTEDLDDPLFVSLQDSKTTSISSIVMVDSKKLTISSRNVKRSV